MTSMQPGQPGTGWAITSQQEASEVGDASTVVQGMRVFFRTQHGSTGSVFVPREAYTAERVRQLVNDQAATMDNVHRLEG